MNKKKFLATCTLVAFGSTMLPAFAFAGSVATAPTAGNTTPVVVTLEKFTDEIDTSDSAAVTKDGANFAVTLTSVSGAKATITPTGNWAPGNYVVTVTDSDETAGNGDGATETTEFKVASIIDNDGDGVLDADTSISAAELAVDGVTAVFPSNVADPSIVVRSGGKDVAFKTAAAYDATSGAVKITIENAEAGSYIIVLQSGSAAVDSVSFEVTAATAAQAVSAVALGSDGKVAAGDQAKAGQAEAAVSTLANFSNGSEYGVYALANQNGTIAKGAKAIENATVDSAVKVTLPGADIAAGYYGVALRSSVDAGTTVPEVVIQYKDTEKAKADAVVQSINADLDAVKAAIPATLSVGAVNGIADVLAAIGDIEAVDKATAAGVKYSITVLGATDDLSSIDKATGEINTFGKSPVSGNVRVQIAAANNANFKTTDDIAVTVTEASTLAAVKKAYVTNNKMTDYDATANTAKVTLADKDAALSMDAFTFAKGGSVAKGAITFTTTDAFVTDYFDLKTGKVTTLPEKDYTATINVNFVDVDNAASPSISGTIAVTTTIKAAGEEDKELVEAEKVANEKAKAFAAVAGTAMGDGKVTKAEWASMMASYAEFLTAYNAYVEAGGQA